MDSIQIFDNFLSEDDLTRANNIINAKTWTYGHESNHNNINSTPFWIMNLNSDLFFSIYLKEQIEKILDKPLRLVKVYANGQTFGQDGTFHQDDAKENAYTFCIYLNKKIETDGHILIKIPNEAKIIAIEPLHNRAITFKSNLFHKGMSFNRYSSELRICLAWKFLS